MEDLPLQPRVRSVTSVHIPAMIAIADATNLSPWSAQNYLDELQTNTSIMLCLESPTVGTIGFIVGRIVPGGNIDVIPDAEIYNVAVIESKQGNGYGQLLFDGFCKKCLEKDAQNIWLEVRASNNKAIDFYRRNGFEMVQSRNNFYENPREHALLMKLSLKKETA